MKIFDSNIVHGDGHYEGVSNSKEFIAQNPTISIAEARKILDHHKYHSYRTVLLDDWTTGQLNVRALIYECTKENIEIICRQCRISHQVSTKEVFDWMGY
jgi:hypothetical protein